MLFVSSLNIKLENAQAGDKKKCLCCLNAALSFGDSPKMAVSSTVVSVFNNATDMSAFDAIFYLSYSTCVVDTFDQWELILL